MAEKKTYNGWTNYETWCVGLWFDNDESLHVTRRDMAEEAWDDTEEPGRYDPKCLSHSERARYKFADQIKEMVNEMAPNLGASLWADLLNAALSEVDWDDLADNWLADVEGYSEAIMTELLRVLSAKKVITVEESQGIIRNARLRAHGGQPVIILERKIQVVVSEEDWAKLTDDHLQMLYERCMSALRIDCLSEDMSRKLEDVELQMKDDAGLDLASLWVRVIEE